MVLLEKASGEVSAYYIFSTNYWLTLNVELMTNVIVNIEVT